MAASSPVYSLLDLSLYAVAGSTAFPEQDFACLPRHLKDGLRTILCKRGKISRSMFAALLHDRVSDVDLTNVDLKNDHIISLQSCSKLTSLNLSQDHLLRLPRRKTISDGLPAVLDLVRLIESSPMLRSVHLRGLPNMDNRVAFALSHCTQLTQIDLSGSFLLDDEAVLALAQNCHMIESLSLAYTGISDLGLAYLADSACKHTLVEFRINNCKRITDDGIELILEGLPKLRFLLLHGCPNVTERSRIPLSEAGHAVFQITWTI